MAKLEDVILRGTTGAKPAATAVAVGTLYYDTDLSTTSRSNGTTWDDFTDAGGSGSVATDAIWAAKGDLAVATANNAASVLSVGTNGQVLTADSGEATGTKWATVSGTGDVVGPASATTSVPVLFDGTTGKLVKNSTPTGTGNPVLATSPTLTTPTIGVATATSVNKVALTAPATAATLTIADGATLTVSASATITNGTHSGTNTGDQTTVSGNAGTVTVADAGGDTTTWPLLGTAQTGSLAPATDAGLTYNATTNALTATTFVGALTGNADTVTTNANLTGVVTSTGNATAIANGALALAKLANGTAGNVVTYDASGVIAVVGTGTATHVLTSNGAGAAPTFQAAAGGAVATDAIWDAKGDLAGGTGANTAVKLTVGSNGTALVADSTATTGMAWEAFVASRRTRPFYSHDYGVRPSTTQTTPWQGIAIASGTTADITSVANHPGIMSVLASASANSGLYHMWAGSVTAALLITGGEYAEFIVNFQTLTNTTCYFGFHDTLSSTAPTDGCWINVSGTTLDGKCKNNAGPTSTGSSYTITTGVWYRMSVAVNSDATSVQFKVVTCSDGATVFDQAVTGNIPTATGRELGHGWVATNNTQSGTPTIMYIDYMAVGWDSVGLVR